MSKKIIVYTDGSCLNNPGVGGYAGLIIIDTEKHLVRGSYEYTTNNCMELISVIESIKYLKDIIDINLNTITVYTDSTYVMNGAKDWIKKWKQNNWKTYDKKEVANKSIWLQLNELLEQYKIEFQWVKGHSTDRYNNFVDQVARSCASNKFPHSAALYVVNS